MNVLTIQNLSKSFGKQKIIDNLNMSVPEGSVFGFIGQNGAGKTTTMKMVLGLLKPDGGEIKVCREPVCFGKTMSNRQIGYLPDVPEFYDYMTPVEYLRLCGKVIGMSDAETRRQSTALLSFVGLSKATKQIGGFSRGMKQRLGIAQALLAEPKLLICDEPTSALDPVGRKEILDILRKISSTTTVLFSTHILSDVERICDRVAFLNEGKIATDGTLAEVKAKHGHDSLLVAFSCDDELRKFKEQEALRPFLSDSEENSSKIVLHSKHIEQVEHTLFLVLAEAGLHPVKIEIMQPSLESLFLEVTK